MKEFIEKADLVQLEENLKTDPSLSNQLIRFGPENQHQVHPLHFICDCVFEGKISDDDALQMAQLLVQYGANINGELQEGKDTPLIAACSLHSDKVALYLIDLQANLIHKGTHGGTALHWACWTGAVQVVEKLLGKGLNLEEKNNEFQASPLHWAIHGFTDAPEKSQRDQKRVIELLLSQGLSTSFLDPHEVRNGEKYQAIKSLLLPYMNS